MTKLEPGLAQEASAWNERSIGVVLALFTVAALLMVLPETVAIVRHQADRTATPVLDLAFLLATPWLFRTSYQLTRGRFRGRPLAPPGVLMVLGMVTLAIFIVFLIAGMSLRVLWLPAAGIGAIHLAYHRWWLARHSLSSRGAA